MLGTRSLVPLAAGLALATPAWPQAGEAMSGGSFGQRPLNLSLPREAIFPPEGLQPTDRRLQDNLQATGDDSRRQEGRPPVALGGQGAWQPYGVGFEARQRGSGAAGFGGGRGGGHGRASGRGR